MININKSFQRFFYSAFISNTSGLGLPNAQLGTLTWQTSNFPQSKIILNNTSAQEVLPEPTVGSNITYTSAVVTTPPFAALVHSSTALTKLSINLTPGGILGTANLTMYELWSQWPHYSISDMHDWSG